MKVVKKLAQIGAETVLCSVIGSIFWMALGRQAVALQLGGGWEYASGTTTFFHFAVSIAQLYLLYRAAQWAITYIGKKAGKAVDVRMNDVPTYTRMRDRVADTLQDSPRDTRSDTPPENPRQPDQDLVTRTPHVGDAECPWCGSLPDAPHLIGCARPRQ